MCAALSCHFTLSLDPAFFPFFLGGCSVLLLTLSHHPQCTPNPGTHTRTYARTRTRTRIHITTTCRCQPACATIRKAMVQINALSADMNPQNFNPMPRWVNTKEEHAQKIILLAADYSLAQRVKAFGTPKSPFASQKDYLDALVAHHVLIQAAMKSKQTVDVALAGAVAPLTGHEGRGAGAAIPGPSQRLFPCDVRLAQSERGLMGGEEGGDFQSQNEPPQGNTSLSRETRVRWSLNCHLGAHFALEWGTALSSDVTEGLHHISVAPSACDPTIGRLITGALGGSPTAADVRGHL